MSVMPGSLDHLYYGGVLDTIPYDAYAPNFAVGAGMNSYGTGLRNSAGRLQGTHYLDYAKQGLAYNTYQQDQFNYNTIGAGLQSPQNNNQFTSYQGQGRTFGEEVIQYANNVSQKITNTSPIMKGIVALGIMGLTLACILKGGKKNPTNLPAPTNSASGFWTRLNPKNWFKK